MFFMLDNYDSFVYNLSAYMEAAGEEILVKRADEVRLSDLDRMNPEGIILSPGPGRPSEAKLTVQIIEKWKGKVPLLGVCLGHQAIGYAFGARIEKGSFPMHGKVTAICNKGEGLFTGLPQCFQVTRYHSLVVGYEKFPDQLRVDAVSDDGVIMALSHQCLPVYGVQFHPEAVLTEYGHELMTNFIGICREWRCPA